MLEGCQLLKLCGQFNPGYFWPLGIVGLGILGLGILVGVLYPATTQMEYLRQDEKKILKTKTPSLYFRANF